MNNKNINFQFLKVILENDLTLFNLRKGFFPLNKKNNSIFILNLFFLNKILKQFIRILYFMKSLKNKLIFILLQNKMFINLFYELVNYNKNNDLLVSSSFPKKILEFNSKYFLFFNENNNKFSYKTISSLFNKKIFLITMLNSLLYNNKNSSIYKINSRLDDFKKISFFFILIRQSLINIKKNA
jgi:hypothetical protein